MHGEEKGEAETALPSPRANPELVGHDAAEQTLLQLYRSRRLPHAILFAGPRGIGKATLAFRLARFLLAQAEAGIAESNLLGAGAAETSLSVDPEKSVFRRVAAGAHADLLTVERAWDPRRRRLRGEIVVEDAREIAAFFRFTAAEEGWRIVVVDGADEMNRNAANALLKILEEPPARALLLLVSHSPGRLLPTIRSRCRRMMLAPLPSAQAAELVRRYRPQLGASDAATLARLSEGSVGRALELADAGGVALYRSLVELLLAAPAIDFGQLHALAERLARPDAEDAYRASEELLCQFLARLAAGSARGGAAGFAVIPEETGPMQRLGAAGGPAQWAACRDEIGRSFAAARELNLDKKQTLLGAFFAIVETAR